MLPVEVPVEPLFPPLVVPVVSPVVVPPVVVPPLVPVEPPGSSTSCSSGGAGRSAGGTGIGSGRSLVTIIIGSSAGFGLAGLHSCFLCCLLGGFLCLGLRLCGNKSGCLRLTYLDFFSLFAAAA